MGRRSSRERAYIGRGEEYSIQHYANTISDILSYDSKTIVYNTNKFVGVKSKCLDIGKLKTYILKFNYTPLEKGLKELLDWENQQHG